VTADKAADTNYAVVTSTAITVTVGQAAQAALTAVATPASIAYNGTSTLSTTGGSGTGAVTYAVVSGGSNCSVTGSTLTGTGIGTCTVTATKAADTNYAVGTSAAIPVTVGQAAQAALTAVATPASIAYNGTSTLSTTGGSGTGAVTYAVVSGGSNCSVTGSTLTGTGIGTCTVTATKAVDANYAVVTSVAITITVGPAAQTALTASSSVSSIVKGNTAMLSATGGSGTGVVSYQVTTGNANCSITGTTLLALANGACSFVAVKAADANFTAQTSAPVGLNVTVPTLQFSVSTLTINGSVSSLAIPASLVQITADGAVPGLAVSITPGSWLTGGLSSTSVGTGNITALALQPNQMGLTAGSYSAVVTVSAPGVVSITLPVTLNLASFGMSLDSTGANPNRPANAAAELQSSKVTFYENRSGTQNSNYNSDQFVIPNSSPSCTAQYQGSVPANASYVTVDVQNSPSQTVVGVSAQTSNLPIGTYRTQVTITQVSSTCAAPKAMTRSKAAASPLAAADPPLVLDITLVVSPTATVPAVSVSPASVQVSVGDDGSVVIPALSVSASPSQPVQVSLGSPDSWLVATASSPNAPTSIALSTAGNLANGTYFNSVVIYFPSTGQSLSVPVTVQVNRRFYRLTSSQSQISFTATTGNIGQPVYTTINSADIGGVPFRIKSAPSWITATPNAGPTPALVAVSADASKLAPGTYTGQIVVATDAPAMELRIAVTATVRGCSIAFGAENLAFGQNTFTASIMLGTQANCPWTLSSSASWLTIQTPTGTGTSPIYLSASPNLDGSSRSATVSSGAGRLVVTQSPMRPVLSTVAAGNSRIPATVNGASMAVGPVAPGQTVSLFGEGFGPYRAVTYAWNSDHTGITSNLSDVQVLFNNVPAPLLMVSYGQINVIAPWGLRPNSTATVQVLRSGVASAPANVVTVAANPGIFTTSQTGSGPAAVLNQDNSINGTFAAAKRGDIIQIFATGLGALNPNGGDGMLAAAPFGMLGTPVRVQIGGKEAAVVYAGVAPQLINSIMQINALIPANAPTGANVPLRLLVGDAASQELITIVVE
jgi:uncharacterized protein (TIGR03437 family)